MGLAAAAAAAGLTWFGCRRALRASTRNRGSDAEAAGRWRRTNHAGDPVTLLEGPAFVAGAAAGLAVRAVLVPEQRRRSVAVAVALLGSGLVGGYDDLYGSTQAKGFGGHLRALRRGEVTSGMVKIAGVGISSLLAASIGASAARRADGRGRAASGRLLDLGLDAAMIASSANLINLFDLRPGRALKAGVLLALKLVLLDRLVAGVGRGVGPISGGGAGLGAMAPVMAPVAAAALGALPADLAGRAMLGDCGANALGAAVAAAATGTPRSVRLVVLAVTVGLNLLSERHSFTAVIEANPLLCRIDRFGRPR